LKHSQRMVYRRNMTTDGMTISNSILRRRVAHPSWMVWWSMSETTPKMAVACSTEWPKHLIGLKRGGSIWSILSVDGKQFHLFLFQSTFLISMTLKDQKVSIGSLMEPYARIILAQTQPRFACVAQLQRN